VISISPSYSPLLRPKRLWSDSRRRRRRGRRKKGRCKANRAEGKEECNMRINIWKGRQRKIHFSEFEKGEAAAVARLSSIRKGGRRGSGGLFGNSSEKEREREREKERERWREREKER
jgi:hypothetical protein